MNNPDRYFFEQEEASEIESSLSRIQSLALAAADDLERLSEIRHALQNAENVITRESREPAEAKLELPHAEIKKFFERGGKT